jgi:hypothetical protein
VGICCIIGNTMAKHHFVPQTYLRAFATDDDADRVYFFDRRVGAVHKRLIRDVCTENNLYELENVEHSGDLEDMFGQIAEPLFREMRNKLLNRESLSMKEKSEFAAYIAIQVMRTPFSRGLYDAMAKKVWDDETKKALGRAS